VETGLCRWSRWSLICGALAVQAVRRRYEEHDSDIAEDAARYFEMAERYRLAAIATFRAKRERSQS
jgi:hypothetical protein